MNKNHWCFESQGIIKDESYTEWLTNFDIDNFASSYYYWDSLHLSRRFYERFIIKVETIKGVHEFEWNTTPDFLGMGHVITTYSTDIQDITRKISSQEMYESVEIFVKKIHENRDVWFHNFFQISSPMLDASRIDLVLYKKIARLYNSFVFTSIVSVNNNHWTTLCIKYDPKDEQFKVYYCNSLGTGYPLPENWKAELEEIFDHKIKIHTYNSLQQKDLCNCGIFTIRNAYIITQALKAGKTFDEIDVEVSKYQPTAEELKKERQEFVEVFKQQTIEEARKLAQAFEKKRIEEKEARTAANINIHQMTDLTSDNSDKIITDTLTKDNVLSVPVIGTPENPIIIDDDGNAAPAHVGIIITEVIGAVMGITIAHFAGVASLTPLCAAVVFVNAAVIGGIIGVAIAATINYVMTKHEEKDKPGQAVVVTKTERLSNLPQSR